MYAAHSESPQAGTKTTGIDDTTVEYVSAPSLRSPTVEVSQQVDSTCRSHVVLIGIVVLHKVVPPTPSHNSNFMISSNHYLPSLSPVPSVSSRNPSSQDLASDNLAQPPILPSPQLQTRGKKSSSSDVRNVGRYNKTMPIRTATISSYTSDPHPGSSCTSLPRRDTGTVESMSVDAMHAGPQPVGTSLR